MSTLHDAVAGGYNSDTGIIAAKNDVVAQAVAARWRDRTDTLRVVDLGVGDGAMLARIADLPIPLAMTGLDVSSAMLRKAKARVALRAVQAPAQDALDALPAGEADLVLAHFILAYVPCGEVARQAHGLLAPGGVFSLATTTEEESAPFYQGLERHFRSSRNPVRRALCRVAERGLALSNVPRRWEELEGDLAAAGFAILSRRTLRVPMAFRSPADAYRFGIEEGWAANFLAASGLPLPMARAAARLGLHLCDYPFEFTQVVEIVEAGRAAEHFPAAADVDLDAMAAD